MDFEHRVITTEYLEFAREYHYKIHDDPGPLKDALTWIRELAAEELKHLDSPSNL